MAKFIPSKQQFYLLFMRLVRDDQNWKPMNKSQLRREFLQVTNKLDREDYETIVDYLLRNLKKNGNLPEYKSFLLAFFTGLVHYLPNVLLDQLTASDVTLRLKAIKLMHNMIRFIRGLPEKYSLTQLFLMKSENCDANMLLVWRYFLRRSKDVSALVRLEFIHATRFLLTCGSELCDRERQTIGYRISAHIGKDETSRNRLNALKVVETAAQYKPTIVYSNSLIINSLMYSCTMDKRFARQACPKVLQVYKYIAQNCPRQIFNLPELAQLRRALIYRAKRR